MKLNGKEYFAGMGDLKRYAVPQFKKWDLLEFPYPDETPPTPGVKRVTKGKYWITDVRPSATGLGHVYELVRAKTRSNYTFPISTISIEKAVADGAIQKYESVQA